MSLEIPIKEATIGAAAPPKLAPGSLGKAKKFKTNAAKIVLTKNYSIYKFDVDICLVYEKKDGTEAKKSLTKGPSNDCLSQARTTLANRALKMALDRNAARFKCTEVFYDSQANLYSIIEGQDFIENLPPSEIVPGDDACKSVEVKVSRVADSHQVTTNDIKSTVNPVFGKGDVTLLEAMNTMISQSLNNKDQLVTYKGVHFVLDPQAHQFDMRKLPRLPGGQYMGVGLMEAVKTLEGEKQGGPQLHCIYDSKKSAFHEDYQCLIDKFGSLLESKNERFNNRMLASDPSARFLKEKVKGLAVRLNYGKNKNLYDNATSFIIGGFGATPATQSVTTDDGTMTVQQYFKRKFKIDLKYPNLFTVFDKKKPDAFFPPELLLIGENQRVKTEQLTVAGQQDMVRSSAVLPSVREEETKKLARLVGINGNNANLKQIGITIDQNNVVVNGRIMPTPNVATGNGMANFSVKNCKWDSSKFKKAAQIPKWSVYSIDSGIDINVFLDRIRRRVISTGMVWVNPKVVSTRKDQRFDVEKTLAAEKNEGTKFVFFVVRDKLDLHQEIKLLEHKYDILTQEVRATVAYKVVERGQAQTVENIVNKMNLKLGGVNWEVSGYNVAGQMTDFLDPRHARLFIGFESSRGIGDNLVVVGYSANASEHAQNFLGNYKFVQNHKDTYGQVLKVAIHEMVQKFRKSRRNAIPAHLYFYFNGISEGQFTLVANDYVARIKEACKELHDTFRPNITIICVSKSPAEKIINEKFSGTRATEQNIPPGSCVDTVIVSPVVNEFFLNSHSAFQGSAKTPKFSQVFDTSNLTMNHHEGFAHQLCFLHGIVSSTISLPAPIMVADRMAKRGTSNYQASRDMRSVSSGKNGEIDIDALNRELSYSEKNLFDCRFNA